MTNILYQIPRSHHKRRNTLVINLSCPNPGGGQQANYWYRYVTYKEWSQRVKYEVLQMNEPRKWLLGQN